MNFIWFLLTFCKLLCEQDVILFKCCEEQSEQRVEYDKLMLVSFWWAPNSTFGPYKGLDNFLKSNLGKKGDAIILIQESGEYFILSHGEFL